ncbi:hypothetical protein DSM100688_1896 [Bifidobacterium ramosum]|uniref:SpaA-like prealbumin fold domain-containing protein n=1 Tax=Bifidobacterium ramosum TaxID=1798158 RepID=A0A6L4WYH4_9BIFI|nr:hypothetical protein DSM100688_1896 [Bifidobacterium ramosum]
MTIVKSITADKDAAITVTRNVTLTSTVASGTSLKPADGDTEGSLFNVGSADGKAIGNLTIGTGAQEKFAYSGTGNAALSRRFATVYKGSSLTINGGTFSYIDVGDRYDIAERIYDNGRLVEERGATAGVAINRGGAITVNSGVFDHISTRNQFFTGVFQQKAGSITVNNGTFSSNTGVNGAVISNASTGDNEGGDITVANGSFTGNKALGAGGGVISQDDGNLVISGGLFKGNGQDPGSCSTDDGNSVCRQMKSGGGAIHADGKGSVTIQGDVKFIQNYAKAWSWGSGGGALWIKGTLRIRNKSVTDANGKTTILRPTFEENYASVSKPATNGNREASKVERGGAGGALFLEEGSVAYLTGGVFAWNVSGYLGGAIYTEINSTTYVGRTATYSNVAGHFGGGLWFCPSGSSTASEGGNVAVFDNDVDQNIDANTQNLSSKTGFLTEAGADLALMNPYKKWNDETLKTLQPTQFKLLSSWFTDRTEQTVEWYKDGIPKEEASGFYDSWLPNTGGATGHGTVAVHADGPRYQAGASSNDKVINESTTKPESTTSNDKVINESTTKPESTTSNDKVINESTTKPESTTLYLYVPQSAEHTKLAEQQSDKTTTKFTTGVGLKAEVLPTADKQQAIDSAQILVYDNSARLSGGGIGSNGVIAFATPYTASWSKAAQDASGNTTDTLLSGSEWELSIQQSALEDKQAASPYMEEDFRPQACQAVDEANKKNCWSFDASTKTWSVTVSDDGFADTNPDVGKIGVENLQPGTYTLKETKAPTGYKASNITYTFTIKTPTGNAIPEDPTIYEVQEDGTADSSVSGNKIGNAPLPGVSWGKVDTDSGAFLSESQWTVTKYKSANSSELTDTRWTVTDCVHNKDKGIDCSRAENNGDELADHDNDEGKFNISGLDPGKYQLRESATPNGYWDPELSETYVFTIPDKNASANNQSVTLYQADGKTPVGSAGTNSANIVNKLPQISWKKVAKDSGSIIDSSSTEWAITGPVAVLTDGDAVTDSPENVESVTASVVDCSSRSGSTSDSCDQHATGLQQSGTGTSARYSYNDLDNAKGFLTISGLQRPTAEQDAAGIRYQYVLTETKAPDGYVKSAKEYVFSIGARESDSNLTVGESCSSEVGGTNCIPNVKTVSALPLTGGPGNWAACDWMLVGGGIAAVAIAALALTNEWRKRKVAIV